MHWCSQVEEVIQIKWGCYPCPKGILLLHHFSSLENGWTFCVQDYFTRRIGWPKDHLNMPKSAPRRSNRVLYGKTNRDLVLWMTKNKSYIMYIRTQNFRISSSACEENSRAKYHRVPSWESITGLFRFLNAIDRGNHIREVGSVCASSEHCKME